MYQQIKQACHKLLVDLEEDPILTVLARWPWGWAINYYRSHNGYDVHLSIPRECRLGIVVHHDGFRETPEDAARSYARRMLVAIDQVTVGLAMRKEELATELAAIDEALVAQRTLTDHESATGNDTEAAE